MDLLDEAQKKQTQQDPPPQDTATIPDLSALMEAQSTINTNASSIATDIAAGNDLPQTPEIQEAPAPESLWNPNPNPLPPTPPATDNNDLLQPQTASTEPLQPVPEPAEQWNNGPAMQVTSFASNDPVQNTPTPTPPQKKKSKIGFVVAGVLLLLLTLPVIGFFVNQQQQIADNRGRASSCAPGEWSCNGNCANSGVQNLFKGTWCDGQGRWLHEAGCGGNPSRLKSEGCDSQGGGGSQPPAGNASMCGTGSATACRDVSVNGRCNDFPGTCRENNGGNLGSDGKAVCGCFADTAPTAEAPSGAQNSNNNNTCSSSSPTSQGCFGVLVDNRCTGFNGTCRRTSINSNGNSECACVPNTTTVAPTSPTSGGGNNNPQTGCTITSPPNLVDGPITLSSNCPDIQLVRYESDAPRGSTSQSCIGTSTNPTYSTAIKGENYPTGVCGKCVQIDLTHNGQNWGSAKYTGDCATTPTTPPVTAQCQNIKLYRNNTLLTTNQYNTIKPGQQIVLAVVGVNAEKARFSVNNAAPIETAQRNNASEWILPYTVPTVTTATTFTIQAEIYGNGQWR